VVQTGPDGNTSSSDITLTIDTVGATQTVQINAISIDSGTPGDFITNDTDGLTVLATLSSALATNERLQYSRDNGVNWIDITNAVTNTAVSYNDNLLTGTTTIKMRVLDVAGNPGSEASQLITIQGGTPPGVSISGITEDTGTFSNDFVTNDANGLIIHAKLTTALSAGEKLMYSSDGTSWSDITAQASISGTDVSYTDNGLTSTRTVSLRVENSAGTSGATASQLITIDTLGATQTVRIDSISVDSGVADFYTNDNDGLTIRATLSAPLGTGEKLEYSRDGVNWTNITPSVTGTGVSYEDATLTSTSTVYLRVVDLAGNPGAQASQLISIDTTAPTQTVHIDSISLDTGTLDTDFITNDNNGLSIKATLSAPLGTTDQLEYSRDGGNTWVVIPNTALSGTAVSYEDALLTQSTTIKMRVVDQAHNLGPETQQAIVIDNTAPGTTVTINSISLDSGAADFITNDNDGLTIRATLSAALSNGDRLQYSTDGTSWTDISHAVTGQNVSYEDPGLTSTKTIHLRVVDAAGNAGTQASQLITIDTDPPTTGVHFTGIADDTGTAGDYITADTNGLIVSATLTAQLIGGERLMYSHDNGLSWTNIGSAIGADGVTVNYFDADLKSSATIKIQVVDVADNAGPGDSKDVTILGDRPSTTVTIQSITQDSGVPNDFITNDADGLIIGARLSTALVGGETLMYSSDGVNWTNISSFIGGDGVTVSYFDSTLTSTKTVYLHVENAAGAAGPEVNRLITIDTTGATQTVSIDSISIDSGTLANDFITNDNDGLTIKATLSSALATGEILQYSRDNGANWINITGSISGGTNVSYEDANLTSTATIQMRVLDIANNPGAATSTTWILMVAELLRSASK
jgi:hypothetical protein